MPNRLVAAEMRQELRDIADAVRSGVGARWRHHLAGQERAVALSDQLLSPVHEMWVTGRGRAVVWVELASDFLLWPADTGASYRVVVRIYQAAAIADDVWHAQYDLCHFYGSQPTVVVAAIQDQL